MVCLLLIEIGCGNMLPHIMGQMAGQQLINEIDGPEDIMDDHQDDGVVVVPAYQDGVDPEDAVDDAFVPVIHGDDSLRTGF
jgi:hypothetical protein